MHEDTIRLTLATSRELTERDKEFESGGLWQIIEFTLMDNYHVHRHTRESLIVCRNQWS